jgi:6-phosphofructo-2-kinase/fructose-2,6-biphosphatase 4
VADYWSRIRDQQVFYEEVTAEEGPFIKVMNVGERIEVNRIEGELAGLSRWYQYALVVLDS